jgi:hypothetical protein
MNDDIRNAIVKSVSLSSADHGCLSAWLHLDYGGSGQGFGGYNLFVPDRPDSTISHANYAGHFIWRCMEVAGVTEWKDIPGKTIRVRGTHAGIEAIGHVIKDLWFCPRDELSKMEEQAKKRL